MGNNPGDGEKNSRKEKICVVDDVGRDFTEIRRQLEKEEAEIRGRTGKISYWSRLMRSEFKDVRSFAFRKLMDMGVAIYLLPDNEKPELKEFFDAAELIRGREARGEYWVGLLTTHTNPRVRLAALHQLGELNGNTHKKPIFEGDGHVGKPELPNAERTAILKALEDSDEEISVFSAELCGDLFNAGDREVVKKLKKALSRDDGRIKNEAAYSLGKLRALDAIEVLLNEMKNVDKILELRESPLMRFFRIFPEEAVKSPLEMKEEAKKTGDSIKGAELFKKNVENVLWYLIEQCDGEEHATSLCRMANHGILRDKVISLLKKFSSGAQWADICKKNSKLLLKIGLTLDQNEDKGLIEKIAENLPETRTGNTVRELIRTLEQEQFELPGAARVFVRSLKGIVRLEIIDSLIEDAAKRKRSEMFKFNGGPLFNRYCEILSEFDEPVEVVKAIFEKAGVKQFEDKGEYARLIELGIEVTARKKETNGAFEIANNFIKSRCMNQECSNRDLEFLKKLYKTCVLGLKCPEEKVDTIGKTCAEIFKAHYDREPRDDEKCLLVLGVSGEFRAKWDPELNERAVGYLREILFRGDKKQKITAILTAREILAQDLVEDLIPLLKSKDDQVVSVVEESLVFIGKDSIVPLHRAATDGVIGLEEASSLVQKIQLRKQIDFGDDGVVDRVTRSRSYDVNFVRNVVGRGIAAPFRV